jgi:Domain of unknown function (DUF1963)
MARASPGREAFVVKCGMAHVTKEMFRERFVEAGLGAVWPELEPLFRASIAIITSQSQDHFVSIGASKQWGAPDLPPEFVWPERDGQPCEFLGQINLAEVAPYDTEKLLPEAGLLSFFLREDFGEEYVNSDPVFYFPPDVLLEPRPREDGDNLTERMVFDFTWTLPRDQLYRVLRAHDPQAEELFEEIMRVFHGLSGLPDPTDLLAAQKELSPEAYAQKQLDFMMSLLAPPASPSESSDPLWKSVLFAGSSLLGYPNTYQGDQEPQCEVIYRGVESEGSSELRQDVQEQAYRDWICLLDTFHPSGVFSLSYCIRRYDLEGWDFTKTVMIAVN